VYFKEKENTNIDSEFESKKKLNFKKMNPKTILIIVGILVLMFIAAIVFVAVSNNSSNDYTLELLGSEQIIINLGDDYVEPGYKAYDQNNNDVTTKVEVTKNIDFSKIGDYEILYMIKGVSKVRRVTIIEKQRETYIYLFGETTMNLKVGQQYIEPGYNVYDIKDKDLKVIITGEVDTSKKGTYTITYSVTNSRNVTITKTRKVIVE
jgi:hypothetical protein